MKLIFAIIHDEDTTVVTNKLTDQGFKVTKLCSTGGFLRAGNTTLIVGIEDNEVEEVLNIIKQNSKSRIKPVTYPLPIGVMGNGPVEITVGGATIFVINVEGYEKV